MNTVKRISLMGLGAAVALAACTSAQAQLIMTIDTAAKTYSLSGSDSGVLSPLGIFYSVSWHLAAPGVDTGTNTGVSYSLSPGNNVGGSLNFSVAPSQVALTISADAAAQTISGSGTAISYAGLSANNQAALEGLIGQTMPLTYGSGFGGVSVVPEPHEYAAMAALGLLGFAGFRRWRQRA